MFDVVEVVVFLPFHVDIDVGTDLCGGGGGGGGGR